MSSRTSRIGSEATYPKCPRSVHLAKPGTTSTAMHYICDSYPQPASQLLHKLDRSPAIGPMRMIHVVAFGNHGRDCVDAGH